MQSGKVTSLNLAMKSRNEDTGSHFLENYFLDYCRGFPATCSRDISRNRHYEAQNYFGSSSVGTGYGSWKGEVKRRRGVERSEPQNKTVRKKQDCSDENANNGSRELKSFSSTYNSYLPSIQKLKSDDRLRSLKTVYINVCGMSIFGGFCLRLLSFQSKWIRSDQ